MDFSKLERLPQVKIDKPCPENWDAMEGDEQKRFCAGCGRHVHNVAEMSAVEAEALFTKPERVCARLTVNDRQSILTRDGWIPRTLLAGAVIVTVMGCSTKEPAAATPAPTVASTTPSTLEVVEELIEDLIEDIKEAIVPGSRPHMMIMGDVRLSGIKLSGPAQNFSEKYEVRRP